MTARAKRKPPSRARCALIVDDDAATRAFTRVALEDAGFTVSEARDGEDGLSKLRRRNFDVVVLDLAMPAVDGFEVLNTLREMPSRAETPVVVVTAHHDPGGVLRTIGSGAVDHVAKPFSQPELLEAVERAISGAGTEDRRNLLWRTAQAYQTADTLQHIAAEAVVEAAAPRSRFGRRR